MGPGQPLPTNDQASAVFRPIGQETDWLTVAAGPTYGLALKTNRSLWAWGTPPVGPGSPAGLAEPIPVLPGTRWRSIATGLAHALAIQADGSLWSWGANNFGQLGDGTTTERSAPVRIGDGTNWTAVSAGLAHSAGMQGDGSVWAWGDDAFVGKPTHPTRVGTDTDWIGLAAGVYITVAWKADGTCHAWGVNAASLLARPAPPPRQPGWFTVAPIPPLRQVSVGSYHALAITPEGTLFAWGQNSFGELGDNTRRSRPQPVRIGRRTDWVALSTWGLLNVGLTDDGAVWAWGTRLDLPQRASRFAEFKRTLALALQRGPQPLPPRYPQFSLAPLCVAQFVPPDLQPPPP